MFPLWTTSPESAVSSFHRLILDWRWFLMMWRCARNFLILIVSEVLPPFVFHRHSISRRCGSWETHSQGWKLGKLSKGENDQSHIFVNNLLQTRRANGCSTKFSFSCHTGNRKVASVKEATHLWQQMSTTVETIERGDVVALVVWWGS